LDTLRRAFRTFQIVLPVRKTGGSWSCETAIKSIISHDQLALCLISYLHITGLSPPRFRWTAEACLLPQSAPFAKFRTVLWLDTAALRICHGLRSQALCHADGLNSLERFRTLPPLSL
jgi:hypothetical protein